MIRYLLAVLKHRLGAGRGLFALTVAGVALGVASVTSIQILNASAIGAFSGALRAVSGPADLSVRAASGTLDEALFPRVLGAAGVAAAWPRVDVTVALEDTESDEFLRVLGLDIYSAAGLPWAGEDADPTAALRHRGWVAVSPRLAAGRGWEAGGRVPVSSGTRRADLYLGAFVDFAKRVPTAGTRLAVMDIADAQQLFGFAGRLHQVDVAAAPGADLDALRARLAAALGPGVRVFTPETQRDRQSGLLEAFRLNITALSMVSLVVGFFLVVAATRASLARRRRELGLMRAVGATPRQVLGLLLAEAAALGALGVAIGIPLGYAAAAANLDVVAGSLSNLYLVEQAESLVVPGWLLGLAAALGVGGALTGAALPCREMTRRDPRALLAGVPEADRARALAGPLGLAAAAATAGAAAAYATGAAASRAGGFALAAVVVVAVPLAAPALVRAATARARARSLGFGIALRGLGAQLSSTAFAVASLAVAVTMMVGTTVMIDSFRRSVSAWVGRTVQADVYVTSRSWKRALSDATLDPALVDELRALPGVRAVDELRRRTLELPHGRVLVNGIRFGLEGGEDRAPLVAGPADAMRRARRDGDVLISEVLARHRGLAVGDRLRLPVAAPDPEVVVRGVYQDFTTDAGEIAMDLARYEALFGAGPPSSVSLYLEPGADPEATVDAIHARWPDRGLWARSNRALRAEVFAIFDQTFAVTRLLQVMALLVAACCVALTLLVQARERAGDVALLGALGATRAQVFRLFLWKGLAIGALGLALGVAGGLALARVLIDVINPAFFGWTLTFHWPGGPVAEQALTILGAAALASWYPARRASATPAEDLSRDR